MSKFRVVLTTKRLTLEPITGAHADGLWRAIDVSRVELKRWMSWADDPRPEKTRDFTADAEDAWREGTAWEFAVIEDREILSAMGLNRVDALWKTCNLGYWMRSDRTGRGLVTEAATALVDFAFTQRDIHRIELVAEPDNKASWRIAEKLGFQREGTKRHGTWTEGEPRDVFLYSLLATDPRPATEYGD